MSADQPQRSQRLRPAPALRRQQDFSRLYARGRRYRTSLLTVVAGPAEEGQTGIRLACVVSKKVSGSAVVRNRIRRRLREIMRLLRPQLTGSAQVALIAHAPAPRASYQEMQATVQAGLRRLGLLPRDGGQRPAGH